MIDIQLFTISFFIKTMQKNIMNFEQPTQKGKLASKNRELGEILNLLHFVNI